MHNLRDILSSKIKGVSIFIEMLLMIMISALKQNKAQFFNAPKYTKLSMQIVLWGYKRI